MLRRNLILLLTLLTYLSFTQIHGNLKISPLNMFRSQTPNAAISGEARYKSLGLELEFGLPMRYNDDFFELEKYTRIQISPRIYLEETMFLNFSYLYDEFQFTVENSNYTDNFNLYTFDWARVKRYGSRYSFSVGYKHELGKNFYIENLIGMLYRERHYVIQEEANFDDNSWFEETIFPFIERLISGPDRNISTRKKKMIGMIWSFRLAYSFGK